MFILNIINASILGTYILEILILLTTLAIISNVLISRLSKMFKNGINMEKYPIIKIGAIKNPNQKI